VRSDRAQFMRPRWLMTFALLAPDSETKFLKHEYAQIRNGVVPAEKTLTFRCIELPRDPVWCLADT
jgi:hypothetical protein